MKVFSRKNALLLAALLIALAAACAFALSRAQTAVMLEETAFAPDGERDAMTVSLEATEDLRTIKGEMRLTAANRTGGDLSEIVLRAYANAIQPGSVTLSDATVNGERASISADSDDPSVWRIETPWRAGETAEVCWRVSLIVPRGEGEIGRTDESALLIGALPTPAMWENGAWREDAYCAVGDPFVSDCSNYEVTLVAPAGYVCAASAKPSVKTMADGRMRYTMQGDAMRDFAFALSASWQTAQKSVNGVTVTAYAGDQKAAGRAAGYAAEALKTYARLYGAYAYDQLTVCEVDFPLGGMEYPGLIFIGRDWMAESQADSLELMLAHETAHQWFYALVGSDQVTDAWQDEALCEYAMLRYAREKYGANAYENLRILRVDAPMREKINQTVTPGSPISYFGSLQTYATVVYGRGAALPLALDEMTGGQMDKLLREYCDAFAFKRASRADFEQFFTDRSGLDITPLMRDYLDTYGY